MLIQECGSPSIRFLLPAFSCNEGRRGGCCGQSQLSSVGGRVTSWTSLQFTAGPHGKTNSNSLRSHSLLGMYVRMSQIILKAHFQVRPDAQQAREHLVGMCTHSPTQLRLFICMYVFMITLTFSCLTILRNSHKITVDKVWCFKRIYV